MSAFGTKRTCASALHMSAFGGKADIIWKKADIKLAVISYLGDLRADAIEAGDKWRWTTSGIGHEVKGLHAFLSPMSCHRERSVERLISGFSTTRSNADTETPPVTFSAWVASQRCGSNVHAAPVTARQLRELLCCHEIHRHGLSLSSC